MAVCKVWDTAEFLEGNAVNVKVLLMMALT